MTTGFELAANGRTATVVIGQSPTDTDRHAADELARYVQAMTGLAPDITPDTPASGAVVLIGTPESHQGIAALAADGLVKVSPDYPGLDGFVVKTVEDAGRSCLVLSGSAPISPLFAVYDVLERACGVGFFCDHEYVPKVESIVLDSIDVAERPYFPLRQNLQACAIGYSAHYWRAEGWKQELDWMAKKKFNALHLCLGGGMARHEAFRALGVESPEPSKTDRAHALIARQNSDYARSLGMDVVTPQVFCGEASDALRKQFPDARYFQMAWMQYDPSYYIHPADPLFHKVITEWLRQYDKLYATTGYYNVDVYAEQEPPGTPDERAAIKAAFGKGVSDAVREVNPEGKWIMSGWGFVERDFWPLGHIRALVDAIPDDILILNDLTSNYTTSAGFTRIYEETDYYHGKNWGWAIFHSFGGNTHLQGDVCGLLENARRVAREPKAANCTAFYNNPEILRHNSFYFDLACKLGWNPLSVEDIASYAADYAERRYGKASAPKMTECLMELVSTCYSWYDMNDFHGPVYQLSPELDDRAWWDRRAEFVPSLARSLRIALSVADDQPDNPCYERDLVDIAKEYAGCVVTQAVKDLRAASKAKDRIAFDDAARRIRSGMDAVERIAALLPEYHMACEIADAAKPPYGVDAHEAAVKIRTRYTILVDFEHYDTLLDYARRDMHELISYYYRPRIEWFISYLDTCLRTGAEPSQQELHDGCIPIARRFVYESPILTAPTGPAEDVIGSVVSALTTTGLLPQS